jgi:tetratricopeptide (TPR) repeat protein
VRYYLGTALERQEEWQSALEAFGQIPGESPLYDDAVAHMSYLYVQTQRTDQAIALLEKRLEQPDPRPQIYYYLAVLHLGAGDETRALTVLDQGLASYPADADLLYEKGLTLERIGDKVPAREVMRQVIAAEPDHAEALNFLAYGLAEENRDLDEALEMAQRAVALKPAGHILDTLGWVYYRLGRFAEARKAIEEASRLLPDDEVIHEHLGDVLQALGKTAAAAAAYEKSLELKPDNEAVRTKLQQLRRPQ